MLYGMYHSSLVMLGTIRRTWFTTHPLLMLCGCPTHCSLPYTSLWYAESSGPSRRIGCSGSFLSSPATVARCIFPKKTIISIIQSRRSLANEIGSFLAFYQFNQQHHIKEILVNIICKYPLTRAHHHTFPWSCSLLLLLSSSPPCSTYWIVLPSSQPDLHTEAFTQHNTTMSLPKGVQVHGAHFIPSTAPLCRSLYPDWFIVSFLYYFWWHRLTCCLLGHPRGLFFFSLSLHWRWPFPTRIQSQHSIQSSSSSSYCITRYYIHWYGK